MRIFCTIFAALLGLAFGSFLNVCLSRWPEGESIVLPRSHCRNCAHTLSWWENIPLLGWIVLRGRCRNCKSLIGVRYPLVEVAVALLWAIAAWQAGGVAYSSVQPPVGFPLIIADAIGTLVFIWMLVALAVLYLENLWLPDFLTWTGIALGAVSWTTHLVLRSTQVLGYFGATALRGRLFVHTAINWLLGVIIAAGIILLIRWLYWLIRRQEGIGLGDAKLMAMLAAWLGLPGTLLAFALGAFLGLFVALVLLAVPSARKSNASWASTKLPFGTFLCIGGIVSSLWGSEILAAYLRFVGL
jgi:leader peptidase (prepilin peptidase)/N-methyltransferase